MPVAPPSSSRPTPPTRAAPPRSTPTARPSASPSSMPSRLRSSSTLSPAHPGEPASSSMCPRAVGRRRPSPLSTTSPTWRCPPTGTAPPLTAQFATFDLAACSGAVVTHTDIVTGLAPVLSLVMESQLGLAFLSSGRDVSTGIEVADPLTLASGVFTTSSRETTNGRLVATA